MALSIRERLALLREKMKEAGIDAWLVVTDDYHASEYVSPHFQCRAFLTGFDGSAGTALIMQDSAALWTDGRYFLQAEDQLKDTGIDLMKMGEKEVLTIEDYLSQTLSDGQVLGFDGRTVSTELYRKIQKKCINRIRYSMDRDLCGEIWEARPALIHNPVFELDLCYAGRSRADKISEIRQKMSDKEVDATVISSLDDIAWLLNLRGNDIPCNPVFLSYLILKKEQVLLYAGPEAVPEPLKKELEADNILLRKYDSFFEELPSEVRGQRVFFDPKRCSAAITSSLQAAAHLVEGENLTLLPKALKNETELNNMRLAHKKDAVAMIRFMRWLDTHIGKERITERSASSRLEEFRREGTHYYGESFAPIAGFREHGAIIHYEATEESDAELYPDSFLLLDTGGQYLEGTTDITRTIPLGTLDKDQKIRYTLVLKGNLDLADAHFPSGVSGIQLDCLARKALWDHGYDYNHGTGHGVGYFLNVHEGPQGIRNRLPEKKSDAPALEPGMILSNEPGLYLPGEYGIRLENLMAVVPDQTTGFGEFYRFETLTLVPFAMEAIEWSMLTERERELLKTYHERILNEIGPELPDKDLEWLKEKLDTEELAK